MKKKKPVVTKDIPTSKVNGLPSFAELIKKLKPAVVNISTTNMIKRRSTPFSSPFEDYFKKFFDDGPEREFKQKGLGTGFIISEDGYVVTNNHVVDKADDIEIILEDGEKYVAKIIGKDPKTDLALLKYFITISN